MKALISCGLYCFFSPFCSISTLTSSPWSITLYGSFVASPFNSEKRCPMRRLMEYTVFFGFVTIWFFAGSPTMRSPFDVKPTMDGVILLRVLTVTPSECL